MGHPKEPATWRAGAAHPSPPTTADRETAFPLTHQPSVEISAHWARMMDQLTGIDAAGSSLRTPPGHSGRKHHADKALPTPRPAESLKHIEDLITVYGSSFTPHNLLQWIDWHYEKCAAYPVVGIGPVWIKEDDDWKKALFEWSALNILLQEPYYARLFEANSLEDFKKNHRRTNRLAMGIDASPCLA